MQPSLISRRDMFRLLAAASAAGSMLPRHLVAEGTKRPPGNAWDPDFLNPSISWEKPLTKAELATLTVLCDLLIPGDENAPPPSKLGLADFLNEWVGAPYDQNIADLKTIRGGLTWIEDRSASLHGKNFVSLEPAQQTAILDSICGSGEITPDLKTGHAFFRKLRNLTLGGYYSHSATWKSLGYVGNVPIGGAYPGVPEEILRKLGLEGI
jgi:hypothetical protein